MIVLVGSLGWGLIAIGAVAHLWHHDRLRELLSVHVDRPRVAAAGLVTLEVVLASAVAIALLSDAGWLPAVAAAGSAVGLAFSLWIARLLLTGSTLPCACSFSDAPTTGWSLVRGLAIVPIGALAVVDADLASADRLAAMVVGLAAGAALYVVPEARSWPEASRAQLARLDSHAPDRTRTAGVR